MVDLLAALRQMLHQFGRPRPEFRITDVDAFDERLTSLEQRQVEIAARLRLLEQQGDPRGINHVDG